MSSDNQIVNCLDLKQHETLSLIDEESNSIGEINDVVLSDLLDVNVNLFSNLESATMS